ncbi:MAG TPA: glycerol-3-phosphate dehydrogenase C-terminal domain-containing protein, partial [Gammaproteobacteria bacterium]
EEDDILAVFAGVRPLPRGSTRATAKLSREHAIGVSRSGLISITGGKWTTYRHMAEDCVDRAIAENDLRKVPCPTVALALVRSDQSESLIAGNPKLAERIHPDLPYSLAQCVWAVREEMAVNLEDVLARRTRALFLNARAALECAPRVAEIVAAELGWDEGRRTREVEAFSRTAENYLPPNRDQDSRLDTLSQQN